MQYLHLVTLAERQRGALAGREDVPARHRLAALDAERGPGAGPPDDVVLFFTDGPYLETKEYLAGSR